MMDITFLYNTEIDSAFASFFIDSLWPPAFKAEGIHQFSLKIKSEIQFRGWKKMLFSDSQRSVPTTDTKWATGRKHSSHVSSQ